ncbi:hypothetical protein ABK040_002350 [Willaertia magna]
MEKQLFRKMMRDTSMGPPMVKKSSPATTNNDIANNSNSPESNDRQSKKFFNTEKEITIDERGIFKVYQNIPEHKQHNSHTVLVFIHGAGLSSLSWALCIDNLKQIVVNQSQNGDYEYCAIDLRGHGKSHSKNDSDLSIHTLVEDVIEVLKVLFKEKKKHFVFIGHSLGASIAVRCSSIVEEMKDVNMSSKGVIVVDMVEGSAVESIPNMTKFIEQRPKRYKSVDSAIKWCIQHGLISNIESASISIPDQLKKVKAHNTTETVTFYEWKTNLEDSEKYWLEWFSDLSKLFLKANGAKLLILTSTETLDKELMIAQMQGKFQLKVINRSGHIIQEDDPKQTSEAIFMFLTRWTRAFDIKLVIKKRMIKTTVSALIKNQTQKRCFSQQLGRLFEDNSKYLKTFSVKGSCASGSTVETVATTCPNVKVVLDEPSPAGANLGPTPLEHSLSSLIGCEIITARYVARAMKLDIKAIECTKMNGVIDIRGMRAVEGVPVHFTSVDMEFALETNESNDKIQILKEKVEKSCPVYQLFNAAGVKLTAEWKKK